jgi:hypothetical protein
MYLDVGSLILEKLHGQLIWTEEVVYNTPFSHNIKSFVKLF